MYAQHLTFLQSNSISFLDASVGNFLGSNEATAATLFGKWNDDIAWWGLAGKNRVIYAVTFLILT